MIRARYFFVVKIYNVKKLNNTLCHTLESLSNENSETQKTQNKLKLKLIPGTFRTEK